MQATTTIIILAALVACATIGIGAYLIYTYYTPGIVTYIPNANKMIPTDTKTGIDNEVIDFSSNECTILFWVYVNKVSSTTSAYNIVQIGRDTYVDDHAAAMAHNICFFLAAGSIILTLPCSNTATLCDGLHRVADIADYMPAERWVQIAATVSLVNKTAQLYIDGEAIASEPIKWTALTDVNVAFPESNHITISGSQGFSGLVSNIAFSKHILTQTNIQSEYDKGPSARAKVLSTIPVYGWRTLFVQK